MDDDTEMAAWHHAEQLKQQEDEMATQSKPLRDYDFGDRVRQKNGLSYVSWADVWDVILQIDPAAEYRVQQFPHPNNNGRTVPYQSLDIGVMVWVDLVLKGVKRTAYLPVMDHRNKTIPEPTATDVNNAIQRCLSKAAAMHGLGLYVYRGEDVSPEVEQAREEERRELETRTISEQQQSTVADLLADADKTEAALCEWLKVESLEAIPAKDYGRVVKMLQKAAAKAREAA